MAVPIILIVLGILLFVIEVLLVPGVTVAGVGGLILNAAGVIIVFVQKGPEIGLWVLLGTVLVSAFIIGMSLRARTWKRLMLKTNVDGTVDTDLTDDQVKAGDRGEAVTRLAPMGKIKINELVREAKSIEGYVDEHTEIEVVEVQGTKISVKPINN
jgi:membrane-bound ClpP family serine protease